MHYFCNVKLLSSLKIKIMKKVFLLLAAAGMTAAAHATILRVSNVTGSSAPYSSFADALEAATPGDTIMVEGSATSYGYSHTINKRIVLIGPGYNHQENGVVSVGAQTAKFDALNINYREVVVQGVTIGGTLSINTPQVVINRCKVERITLNSAATGTVLHQNYITSNVVGNYAKSVSLTNNIFTASHGYMGLINKLENSYIGYNTCITEATSTGQYDKFLYDLSGCTVEHNILPEKYESTSTNQVNDNYVFTETPYYNTSTEVAIRNAELGFSEGKYGAFSGDAPFVLSGLPAGAFIQSITVPASVEQGKKLNVTLKLGIQQ